MTAFAAQPATHPHPYTLLRHVIAAILLLAAALKAHELLTTPTPTPPHFTSPYLHLPAIQFESLLALSLLLNLCPRLVHRLTLLTFSAFTCLTLLKLLAGSPSCGCFGRLSIPPHYTLLLDLTLLISLLLFHPRTNLPPRPTPSPGTPGEGGGEGSSPTPPPVGHAIACRPPSGLRPSAPSCLRAFAPPTPLRILLAIVLLLPLALLTLRPSASSLTILDPPTWLNKPFPLLDDLDIAPQLSTGRWAILLYHHDCPNCQQVLPRYKNLSRQPNQNVALIEFPPYGPPLGAAPLGAAPHTDPNPTWLSSKLPQTKEWFVTTPVELILQDGQVVQVTP